MRKGGGGDEGTECETRRIQGVSLRGFEYATGVKLRVGGIQRSSDETYFFTEK